MGTIDRKALDRQEDDRRLATMLARTFFYAFVKTVRPGYLMGWSQEIICDALDQFLADVLAERSPRLMITMPPRSGKTELVSRCFPAYVLGKRPDLSVIAASYSADLASRNNRDVQRIIDSDRYRELFPETRLWGKNVRTAAEGSYQRNSDIFEVVGRKGAYRSAGVDGGLTGMGGHCLIIDDPFKTRQEADSPTIRDKIWDWYTSTLYTRQAPGGGIILIQTRWHMDDLAGRLLKAMASGEGETWRVLNFPAIAETDEPHRKAGEALHPKRFSLELLNETKRTIGLRDWSALYQQRPAPEEGAVFRKEWLRHWTTLPEGFDRVVMSWDLTFKDTANADYVVGQVWGQKGADCYLLDQVRDRLGFVATCGAFARLAAKWPQALEKLVEDAANGPAVVDHLKRAIPGLVPVKPDGPKTARAHAVTPLFEAGNVYFPDPSLAPWVRDLESEVLLFPTAANDDQVDAMTQALRWMYRHRPMDINPAVMSRVESAGRGRFGAWALR
jgi:predicted phage terminase large subunit-like protein